MSITPTARPPTVPVRPRPRLVAWCVLVISLAWSLRGAPVRALGPVPGLVEVTPSSGFGWPLTPRPRIVRPFEAPAFRFGPGHRGVDLAGTPGQSVFAAGAGTVVFQGMVADRPVISIDHPNGLRTTYEPVLASVPSGGRVERGTVIGSLRPGHPGCPVPACLHWGARRGEDYLDPTRLLSTRVRLLPWDGRRSGSP